MDAAQLEQLAAEIGEAILARSGRADLPVAPARVSASTAPVRRTAPDPAVAALIDHTLLKPEATGEDIRKLCAEARQYRFATVCVNPCWVPLCVTELQGSQARVCTVAGFPLGATATEVKAAEAELSIRAGAREVDMVMNVGAMRSADYERVKLDIQGVVQVCHRAGAIVKVILETALLDEHQKVIACALAKLAQADFVKTSTGFGPAGATVQDVALMRKIVGPAMGVKAAGGIKTLEDLKRMVAAGASRVGASASVQIIEATAMTAA